VEVTEGMVAAEGDKLRVMFVDDELRVLDGLRRLLRPRHRQWAMTFASSGAQALELLEAEPVQILVTDMRMPGMDGAQLLAEVQRRHPETARIILSGQADEEAALRAVPVAHQFLTKPCDADTLIDALERAAALHRLLDDPGLREAVGGVDALPSPPTIWLALNERLQDPEAKPADVAGIAATDPAISAKLLQLVNSSFVGLARRLSSVQEAVTYLGLQTVRSLSLSVGAFRALDADGMLGSGYADALNAYAVACATQARELVTDPADADAAFAAALLQDVGQLVLAAKRPEPFKAMLARADRDGVPLHVLEQEQGWTHAHVGAYLLGLWGLPPAVVEAVARHHDPVDPDVVHIGPVQATQLAGERVAGATAGGG
jgi:HD-like signal output (HDOD) protein/CheY-like chemotaxis protein